MNNVTFNILLLFLQIYCTSELGGGKITGGKGSHVGDLIRTKSGKVFLRRSSKKALFSKKDAAEGSESSNDDKIKVRNKDKMRGKNKDKISQKLNRQDSHSIPSTDPIYPIDPTDPTDYIYPIDPVDTSDCTGVKRVRRYVNTLGSDKRKRLVRAMETLIGNGSRYVDLANFHGEPADICPDAPHSMCCPHRTQLTFLPWHRLLMAQMEDELGEALPYWDWTVDGEIPDLWEGIRAPIKEGVSTFCSSLPDCSCTSGGDPRQFVTRRDSIQLNVAKQIEGVRNAFKRTDFDGFSTDIQSPHDEVHIQCGCDMFPAQTAAYDTVFYLHHSYVDRQWAFWQELQRLRGHSDPTIDGFDQPLPPFDKANYNNNAKTLGNSRAQDTFDYQKKLCYEYDQLLFDGLTPAQYHKLEQATNKISTTSTRIPFHLLPLCSARLPGPCRSRLFILFNIVITIKIIIIIIIVIIVIIISVAH